jgi:hypothetical protein
MTTWQYARLIVHAIPINDGSRAYNYWWHLQLLNRTGSDGWELMYIQSHEGDYHYIFKRPAL